MNAKDFIRKTDWYDQGGEGKIFYMSLPVPAATQLPCPFPQTYERMLVFSRKGYGGWGLSLPPLQKIARSIFGLHLSDPGFLPSLVRLHDEAERKLDTALKQAASLSSLPDEGLRRAFFDACRLHEEAWKPFIFIDGFDLVWEEYIERYLPAEQRTLSEQELKTLLLPGKLSYVQEEELSLCKVKLGSEQDLGKHRDAFSWYTNNYAVIEDLPLEHFRERMDAIKDAEGTAREIESRMKRILEEKERILREHTLPEAALKFVQLISLLGERRDARKRLQAKGNLLVKRHLLEIAKRRKIDVHLLESLVYPVDLPKVFSATEQELEDASRAAFALYDKESGTIHAYGDEAAELIRTYELAIEKEHQEIRGQVACLGKAEGKVCIVNTVSEFSKMKKGDILVSYNTRPEFVPIMKLAAAIVTNEGGITSHAAVVSRELGVPCIIGTRHATRLLKDGDRVEVDAEQGRVRKL